MSILDQIRADPLGALRNAIVFAQQARTTIAAVTDAVKDGSAALSVTDKGELDGLLTQEAAESRAAHDSLASALDEADQRGDGA